MARRPMDGNLNAAIIGILLCSIDERLKTMLMAQRD
jgi:hypothetical protein